MITYALTWIMVLTAAFTPLAAGQDKNDGPKTVTQWLDALEQRGQAIKSLEADVTYNKLNDLTGEQQVRIGSVEYVAANADTKRSSRFAVRFDKLIVDARMDEDKIEYIFDGRWLAEKQYKQKVIIKRQIVKPGESLDPLNLDGPFPLPIGQKRKEVLSRFEVSIVADKKSDGSTVHLQFKPKPDAPKIEGQKEFDRIDLWFNRKELLPTKVVTLDTQGQTTVTLRKLRIDAMSEADIKKRFDTTPPPGWRSEVGGS